MYPLGYLQMQLSVPREEQQSCSLRFHRKWPKSQNQPIIYLRRYIWTYKAQQPPLGMYYISGSFSLMKKDPTLIGLSPFAIITHGTFYVVSASSSVGVISFGIGQLYGRPPVFSLSCFQAVSITSGFW